MTEAERISRVREKDKERQAKGDREGGCERNRKEGGTESCGDGNKRGSLQNGKKPLSAIYLRKHWYLKYTKSSKGGERCSGIRGRDLR